MDKMRLFFEKTGTARFISHLDLNRAFLRAVFARRLPVKFTEGFNPHPHLVFGQPLPLGMAGLRETLDIRLTAPVLREELIDGVNVQLPDGIRVVDAAAPEHGFKEIAFARYRAQLDLKYAQAFARFWEQEEIIGKKKTKRSERAFDVKAVARDWKTGGEGNAFWMQGFLPCSVDGSIGPAVILTAFGEWLGEEIFAYLTREEFLLQDLTAFC